MAFISDMIGAASSEVKEREGGREGGRVESCIDVKALPDRFIDYLV